MVVELFMKHGQLVEDDCPNPSSRNSLFLLKAEYGPMISLIFLVPKLPQNIN